MRSGYGPPVPAQLPQKWKIQGSAQLFRIRTKKEDTSWDLWGYVSISAKWSVFILAQCFSIKQQNKPYTYCEFSHGYTSAFRGQQWLYSGLGCYVECLHPICKCQFKPWLLCFQCSFLLMALGGSIWHTKYLGSCQSYRRADGASWTRIQPEPAPIVTGTWEMNHRMLELSLFSFLNVSPSVTQSLN